MAYIEGQRPRGDLNTGGAGSQPDRGVAGISNGTKAQSSRAPRRTHPGMLGQVPFGQTSEGRLHGMLGRGSPYMRAARRSAKERMAARGLTDSSMAVGAAHRAAIQSAAPFALQDAQLMQRERLTQAGMEEQARQAHLQRQFAGREAALTRAQRQDLTTQQQEFAQRMDQSRRDWQTGERLAGQKFQAGQYAEQRRFQAGQAAEQRQWATTQADLNRSFTAGQAELQRIFAGDQAQLGRDLSRELAEMRDLSIRYGIDKQFTASMAQAFTNQVGMMASSGQFSPSAIAGFARMQFSQFKAFVEWFQNV